MRYRTGNSCETTQNRGDGSCSKGNEEQHCTWPDGLHVKFYKDFWGQLKTPILEMFEKLYREELNMRRLNYGLISLIPWMKEGNNIK